MTPDEDAIFEPTDEARGAFNRMSGDAGKKMMEQFFELWEAEGDPSRAGSMAAQAYICNAARMAVFGARCAGVDPQPDLWWMMCQEAFDQAIADVEDVMKQWNT